MKFSRTIHIYDDVTFKQFYTDFYEFKLQLYLNYNSVIFLRYLNYSSVIFL